MSFNALHSLNALIPMLFTELGIMMDSRLRQYWKALCLMEVTVLGILTDSRFVHLRKQTTLNGLQRIWKDD